MAADRTFFRRLRRMFSTDTIVRNVGGKKLKVVDTDKLQSLGHLATNRLVDRYSRIYGSNASHITRLGQNYTFHTGRIELFNDYEIMDQDSIIASGLDLYAEESTLKNEFGDVLKVKSANEDVQDVLNNLFYDILNIEFNLYPWVRNMCKYGDMFLKLEISEKYGILNVIPLSAYAMTREEGTDPYNPELVQFVENGMQSGGKIVYENYEIAHFRLLSDSNFLPYGKSMIESARKVWKQLILMEDAMLLHRIMRAPERRVFKINVGNIPPAEIDNHMNTIINKIRKVPFVDENTGDYNLKFNIMNMLEDYFLPVRGNESATEIDTLGGLEWTSIEDIEYLRNRMLAALRIPKAFLSFDESVEGKATLAAEDVRFARTIERIQKIIVSELTKIAIVHLYSQGYRDSELVDFELTLTGPSTIYEQEKISLWSEKIALASSALESKLLSADWVYKHVFNMSEDEADEQQHGVIEDMKEKFRQEQIETEGNDPKVTHKSFGTPHDLASIGGDGAEDAEAEEDDETPEDKEDGQDIGIKYGEESHPRTKDPLGKDISKTYRNPDRSIKHDYLGGSPLSTTNKKKESKQESVENLKAMSIAKSLFKKNGKDTNILKESLKANKKAEKDKTDDTFLDENVILED